MPSISPETVVVRRGETLAAPVDDDLVMLDTRRSRYFGLDRIGRRVWDLLEEPRSVDALCGELEDEFDVDAETCRTDVLAFLEQLSEAELSEIR